MEIMPISIKEKIPRGEKDVRNAMQTQLEHLPLTVLHSVGSTEHSTKPYTEVDFVVITKDGIACLEVKGGEVIRRQDGNWEIGYQKTSHYYVSHEGPFKQSMSTVPAVLKELSREGMKKFPVVWGVVFPHCGFSEKDSEWSDYHICDVHKLDNLNEYLQNLFHQSFNQFKKRGIKFPEPRFITKNDIKTARDILRKDFHVNWFSGNEVGASKRELIFLEKNQATYLDEMIFGKNSRMILKGGAGTGKTLLATKAASHFAKTSKRILFLTFNSLLCRELKSHFSGSTVTVRTIAEFMLEFCQITPPKKNTNEFFKKELPEKFADLAQMRAEAGDLEHFDVLVIDEAQDFLSDTVIIGLMDVLIGGFQDGQWLICIDEGVQSNLYGNYSQDTLQELSEQTRCEKRTLFRNLRNPRQIAEKANSLFQNIEMAIPSREFTSPPKYHTCTSKTDLINKISDLVSKLTNQGVNASEITLLTFKSRSSSILEKIKFLGSVSLKHYSEKTAGAASWSQIGAFKGLENEIIILIEIDEWGFELRKSEYFVGMTRAKTELHILCKPNSRVLEI